MYLIREVSLHAKVRYCERCKPKYFSIVDKLLYKRKLTPDEQEKHQELVKEITDVVNFKAKLIGGLTKYNKKRAILRYEGLEYIVKFENKKGKVITIQIPRIP
jgi:hypothetical protein